MSGAVEHSFRDSTAYDLVYDGKHFPPKAICGIAARRISGHVLEPNEFTGGDESKCFAVLRNLNFNIVAKARNSWEQLLPPDPPETVWLENTKGTEHGGPGRNSGRVCGALRRPTEVRIGTTRCANRVLETSLLHFVDAFFRACRVSQHPYQEVEDFAVPCTVGEYVALL